jgi:threonyl-tRNA synthetase
MKNWEKVENAIINAAADKADHYTNMTARILCISKLDFMVKDALGKTMALGTIQWITTTGTFLI